MRHRERLLPPVWLFAVCLLVIPAAVLVFLPINQLWGWIIAVVLYLAVVSMLVVASPRLDVDAESLRAGRAVIPLGALGHPEALDEAASRVALRTGFDAAAYYSTVPWVRRLVRIPVEDPKDPTTAWVVSSRRPEALVAALTGARTTGA